MAIRKRLKNLGAASCCLCFLLACFYVVFALYDTRFWNVIRSGSAVYVLLTFALVLCTASILICLFNWLKESRKADGRTTCDEERLRVRASFFTGGFDLKHALRIAAAIVLCWVPYMVVLYPGVLTYDPIWQIMQCLGSGALDNLTPVDGGYSFSAHKPIIHTWLLGFFVFLGEGVFGSQATGIFIMMVLQCLCTAISLAVMCSYCYRLGAPIWLRRITVLFCALFPFIPIYAMSGFNDALFDWLYVGWFVCFIEIVLSKTECLAKAPFAATFAALGLLLSFTKTPGVYLVLIAVVALALIYRRHIKALAIAALLPTLTMLVIMPMVVYPLANVTKSTSNEALGVLYHSTAAYVQQHPDEVTDSERNAIDKVLIYDELAERYDPQSHDPTKRLQRVERTTEDVFRYMLAWMSMGVRHPGTYAKATVSTLLPFCSPDTSFECYLDETPWTISKFIEGLPQGNERLNDAIDRFDIEDVLAFDDVKHKMQAAFTKLRSIPILGWLFGLGLYATWIPLFFVIGILVARREWTPAIIPVVLSLLLLMVSPLAMSRYALPFVLTCPLMLGVLFSHARPSFIPTE